MFNDCDSYCASYLFVKFRSFSNYRFTIRKSFVLKSALPFLAGNFLGTQFSLPWLTIAFSLLEGGARQHQLRLVGPPRYRHKTGLFQSLYLKYNRYRKKWSARLILIAAYVFEPGKQRQNQSEPASLTCWVCTGGKNSSGPAVSEKSKSLFASAKVESSARVM